MLLYTLTHTSEYNNIIRVNGTYVTYVCVCVSVMLTPFEQSNNTYTYSLTGDIWRKETKNLREKKPPDLSFEFRFSAAETSHGGLWYNIILYIIIIMFTDGHLDTHSTLSVKCVFRPGWRQRLA